MGEIQVKGDLLGRGQGVDHIGHGADAVDGVEGVQRLGAVGHTDGDPVALLNAQGYQGPGRAVNALHKALIGGLLVHKLVGHQLGMLPGSVPDNLIDGLLGILQGLGGVAVKFQPRRTGGNAHIDLFLSSQ